jgi:hypothetical protein
MGIIMKSQEIHELTADEIDHVSGARGIVEAINDGVQTAVGVALVVWDLATNWKDPWA